MPDEPCSETKLRRVTSQLFSEPTPVNVFVLGEMMVYPVPKALLVSASDKFDVAIEEDDNILNLEVRSDAFENFVGWLLRRNIFEARQSRLAEAWCLGQTWEIPEFQNAVILVLVPRAQAAKVTAKAVRKAYAEVGPFPLKANFAMQLAFDWTEPAHETWTTSLEREMGIRTASSSSATSSRRCRRSRNCHYDLTGGSIWRTTSLEILWTQRRRVTPANTVRLQGLV